MTTPSTPSRPSRLALVGTDAQIYLTDSQSWELERLTLPVDGGPFIPWHLPAKAKDGYSWPTWSVDGKWIGCFKFPIVGDAPAPEGPYTTCALTADGTEQVEIHTLRHSMPIYQQWSPDGLSLALLLQKGLSLEIITVRLDDLGHARTTATGSPLFFNWAPDSRSIFMHLGSGTQDNGRIVLREVLDPTHETRLPYPPGSFCAPIFVGKRHICAVQDTSDAHYSTVVTAPEWGYPLRNLFRARGLLAIVPSPDGTELALSVAPKGDGSSYQGVRIMPIEGGEPRYITKESLLAFFWPRPGNAILYVTVDSSQNCLIWKEADLVSGTVRVLGSFWPTREYMFMLHFFDQYTMSHHLVSPCGRYLVFAGHPTEEAQADSKHPAEILLLDLWQAKPSIRTLSRGVMASWEPPSIPGESSHTPTVRDIPGPPS